MIPQKDFTKRGKIKRKTQITSGKYPTTQGNPETNGKYDGIVW